MPVVNLNASNFRLTGTKVKALCINHPGIVLVLFKMTNCEYSKAFEPIFFQLAAKDTRVNYAIVNVSQCPDVVKMSRETTTPINGVPQLILYMDGTPGFKFNGQKNIPSITAFITKALTASAESSQNSGQSTQFMQPNMYGQGQAGYAPRAPGVSGGQNQPKYYTPEIGNAPSMQGMLKGGGGAYSMLGTGGEEEDDTKLIIPENVTPYNTPWANEYKSVG